MSHHVKPALVESFNISQGALSPSRNGSGRLVVLARREVEEELRSKTWMTTDTPPSSAAGCLQRRHTLLYGFSISYQHGTTLIGLLVIIS